MSANSLSKVLAIILVGGPILSIGIAMLVSAIIEIYRDAHTPCSLETYAEKHKCCYYCIRCSGNFCKVTGKFITFTHRKRNCPIFDNKFRGAK